MPCITLEKDGSGNFGRTRRCKPYRTNSKTFRPYALQCITFGQAGTAPNKDAPARNSRKDSTATEKMTSPYGKSQGGFVGFLTYAFSDRLKASSIFGIKQNILIKT